MRLGMIDLAWLKSCLNYFSLSPTYLESNSGPLTAIKLHFYSFAIHFANNVFPVPGGPKNNKFFQVDLLLELKIWSIFDLIYSTPPISCQVTFGISRFYYLILRSC